MTKAGHPKIGVVAELKQEEHRDVSAGLAWRA